MGRKIIHGYSAEAAREIIDLAHQRDAALARAEAAERRVVAAWVLMDRSDLVTAVDKMNQAEIWNQLALLRAALGSDAGQEGGAGD